MKYLLYMVFLGLLGIAPAAAEDTVVVATIDGLADVPAARTIMEEAYRRIGVQVEFRMFTAAEALRKSNAGEVDAELQRIDGISARYPNLVQVPIPINLIQGVAYSRKYRFPVTGWHSLRPYRVGIVEGIQFAEVNTYGMEVQGYGTYADLVGALARDEVDVAVMPRIEGRSTLGVVRLDDIVEMEGVLESQFLYHYVNRNRSDLVDRLRPVLKEMLISGETRRIHDRALAAAGARP